MPWRGRIVAWSGALLIINALLTLGLLQVLLLSSDDDAVQEELGQLETELELLRAENPALRVQPLLEEFLRTRTPSQYQIFLSLLEGVPFERAQVSGTPQIDLDPTLLAVFAAAEPGADDTIGTIDGEQFLWRAIQVVTQDGSERGTLVIASLTDRRAAPIQQAVRIGGLLQMAVGVVLLGLLGDRLARGLAVPLARLTERTRHIRETGLDEQLPVIGDDEVAGLAETINGLLDDTRRELATRRRLIADAGHELRTPITIVRGHLELLPEDPRLKAETLELVDDELDRMAGLVDDLLALATADQPGFVRTGPVDLGDLGARLLATVEPLASDRIWKLDVDESPAVLDERRIRQAVVALVDNAVRHTAEGGSITIRLLRPTPARVEVAVADNGPGVPPDVAEVAFAPFRHGTASTRGTGLGLALVAAIAEGHNGRADLSETPGGGTTVTLTIPQDAEELQ
jgi:signal transduction histidine kinase